MPYISNEARDKIHQRFLNDTKHHTMDIRHDDGVYRHVVFSENGSSTFMFSLATTPGTLLYTGDMGTFVFRRTQDMFQFFHKSLQHHPDFSYWHEKLEATDKHDGSKSQSYDLLIAGLRSYIDEDTGDHIRKQVNEFIEELESVNDDYGFSECYRLANEFRIGDSRIPDFYFADLWDHGPFEVFSDRFIWACYAIQWGVAKYFSHKQAASDLTIVTPQSNC